MINIMLLLEYLTQISKYAATWPRVQDILLIILSFYMVKGLSGLHAKFHKHQPRNSQKLIDYDKFGMQHRQCSCGDEFEWFPRKKLKKYMRRALKAPYLTTLLADAKNV